jgi:hypothetical protein
MFEELTIMTGSKEEVLEALQDKYKFLPVGTLRVVAKPGENMNGFGSTIGQQIESMLGLDVRASTVSWLHRMDADEGFQSRYQWVFIRPPMPQLIKDEFYETTSSNTV